MSLVIDKKNKYYQSGAFRSRVLSAEILFSTMLLQENSIKNDGGEGATGGAVRDTKREMWETDYLQSVAFVSFFLAGRRREKIWCFCPLAHVLPSDP